MAKNHDIRIKVTSLQFETIRSSAQTNGYKTISSYIRQTILNNEDETDKTLKKIYKMLNQK
ncbi:hypothetical protein HYX18_03765 [Candidatus Woesearchaeota archaeon]|nr:hypothetical protein [Candidatus Woesearchaeota archaeon]